MLVLTRKVGEKVIVDGCITVEVVAVEGNKVRIGITAPPEVRVDREEVHVARMEFQVKPDLVTATRNTDAPPDRSYGGVCVRR